MPYTFHHGHAPTRAQLRACSRAELEEHYQKLVRVWLHHGQRKTTKMPTWWQRFAKDLENELHIRGTQLSLFYGSESA